MLETVRNVRAGYEQELRCRHWLAGGLFYGGGVGCAVPLVMRHPFGHVLGGAYGVGFVVQDDQLAVVVLVQQVDDALNYYAVQAIAYNRDGSAAAALTRFRLPSE